MEMRQALEQLQQRVPNILGSESFSKFAVLLPLVQRNGEAHVLFEVRSLQMRRQPGEICFPGGRIDAEDEDARATAIRETCEELGIAPKEITSVAPLDYIVSPFGTIIYPYVGMIESVENMKPNAAEVEEVFTVPLELLKSMEPEVYKLHFHIEPEAQFPFHSIVGGKNYNWQARGMDEYFYYYEDKVIWGLTAKILAHFLAIVR